MRYPRASQTSVLGLDAIEMLGKLREKYRYGSPKSDLPDQNMHFNKTIVIYVKIKR